MPEKFVLLNSGGFDSVVMAHRVRQIYPEAELVSLFFDYSQPNLKWEKACSDKCAKAVKAITCDIILPKFTWTHGSFYEGTSDTKRQYVEYRNLIFLSYAVSLAESWGFSRIYMATHYFSEGFKDGSNAFIDSFNRTIKPSGIRVETPFAYMYKDDLMNIARNLGITKDDFFSCNNPFSDGKPCGECEDCLAIKEMYSG